MSGGNHGHKIGNLLRDVKIMHSHRIIIEDVNKMDEK